MSKSRALGFLWANLGNAFGDIRTVSFEGIERRRGEQERKEIVIAANALLMLTAWLLMWDKRELS